MKYVEEQLKQCKVGSPGIDHRHGGPVVDTADSR